MSITQPKNAWIHNFTVTETQLHGKFTIYRITSVIFPLAQPEALSCVTIWKRYSDVKELHQRLSKKVKRERLRLKLPNLVKDRKQYFQRFSPEVIEERRQFIVDFLDYIGTKPSLYSCDLFTKFLRDGGYSPKTSPDTVDGGYRDLSHSNPLSLDGEKGVRSSDTDEQSSNSLAEDSISIRTTTSSQTGSAGGGGSKGECPPPAVGDDDAQLISLRPKYSSDYLVEAAERFNEAVQHEVNDRYTKALDTYKEGIEILMQGIRGDSNELRRKLAKEKVAKYLSRSEGIYEHFLKPNRATAGASGDHNHNSRATRELPLNQLAKYKVIKVIDDNVMSVQEVTTRRYFIIKSIDRNDNWDTRGLDDDNVAVFNELSSPYMVPLVAYFVTEFVIFLLLQPASGGKLLDYIASFVPEPPPAAETKAKDEESTLDPHIPIRKSQSEYCDEAAPAYESLTSDLDIEELLVSSQKLLHSVQNTLEKTKEQVVEEERPQQAAEERKVEISAENFKRIPEACIRQWAKELIVAVNALHAKQIILGSLGTQNLLLGKSGQLLLTYYHLRDLSHANGGLAPDRPIITQESDWYNVGIVLYELLTGYSFVGAHPGGIWFYFELQFPEGVQLSPVAISLLNGLLAENPEARFGFENICAHPFFNEADWTELQRRGITG